MTSRGCWDAMGRVSRFKGGAVHERIGKPHGRSEMREVARSDCAKGDAASGRHAKPWTSARAAHNQGLSRIVKSATHSRFGASQRPDPTRWCGPSEPDPSVPAEFVMFVVPGHHLDPEPCPIVPTRRRSMTSTVGEVGPGRSPPWVGLFHGSLPQRGANLPMHWTLHRSRSGHRQRQTRVGLGKR